MLAIQVLWEAEIQVQRSADFQSAVARISNPQSVRNFRTQQLRDSSADWKSAIQQVGNLRYAGADDGLQSLD
jgi:hypothetical protein